MEIDRRAFIASLGGAAVVDAMSSGSQGRSARAPFERFARRVAGRSRTTMPSRSWPRRPRRLSGAAPDRCSRRRVQQNERKMPVLAPMPDKPTLVDFFNLRFAPANHVLQSATRALKTGMTER